VPGAAVLFAGELTFMVGTGLLRCRSEFTTEPLGAHGGRSRPPRRRSNADVRQSVSVAAQMSAAGGERK
jgi:hypothetical protein